MMKIRQGRRKIGLLIPEFDKLSPMVIRGKDRRDHGFQAGIGFATADRMRFAGRIDADVIIPIIAGRFFTAPAAAAGDRQRRTV